MSEPKKSSLLSKMVCPACGFERTVEASRFVPGSKLKCPSCQEAFLYKPMLLFKNHGYEGISPQAFTHPMDRKALAAVRKVPGLDFVCAKMIQYGYEKAFRVEAMGSFVKVTPKTCGYIYDMAVQAAKCLDVAVPDVFVQQSPVVNAFTLGNEYPMIVIHSGLIDFLDEDELYAIIAHETGHVKCQHHLYHTVGLWLSNLAAVGLGGGFTTAFLKPIIWTLLYWNRQSELSADRAALLVTDDKASVVKAFMKLAGGTSRISNLIDHEEFLSQGAQFEKLTEGMGFTGLVRTFSTVGRTHPYTVMRASELEKWCNGPEYEVIRSGTYEKRSMKGSGKAAEKAVCPHCGSALPEDAMYCEGCAQACEPLANQYGGGSMSELFDAFMGGAATVKGIAQTGAGAVKDAALTGATAVKGAALTGANVMKDATVAGASGIKDAARTGASVVKDAAASGFQWIKRKPNKEENHVNESSNSSICPTCGTVFEDREALFCPKDGTALVTNEK